MAGANPNAWNNWYHCVGSTYGAWLPGDPRGFRTFRHRLHVEGDYKNPPAAGTFTAIYERSKRLMKRPAVVLGREQREVVCKAMIEQLQRDGVEAVADTIPDGFYLVADSTNPQTEWHKAIIDAVARVTHIAPADANGNIIDEKVVQPGVIAIPSPRLIGLCAGVTNAAYATTTEVYPDSPKATPEQCNRAQVKTITAGLDFIIEAEGLKRAANKAEL